MERVTPAWSSASSATIEQPRHSERIVLKNDAARLGDFHVGWVLWLASFQAPHSVTPSGRSLRTSLPTSRRYWATEGSLALFSRRSLVEMCTRTFTCALRARRT